MLEARNISFTQGSKILLKNTSFRVGVGTCLAVLGPSGSGKTSLLRIVSGLATPDSGSILWNDTLLTSHQSILVPPEKRSFGFVFQDSALFPHLNVLKNVAFGVHHLPKEQRYQSAYDWLKKLGIQDLAGRTVHNLSGGEKQRVALARTLITEPRALLLDEPFSSVDRIARQELIALLKDVLPAMQMATLLVTHDERDAGDLAHEVLRFV